MLLPGILFKAAIFLFIFAAFASLVLMKYHKLCNIAANIICIAASIVGISVAAMQILYYSDNVIIDIYHSAIPFLTINLKIDALSSFFLLALFLLVLCVSIYSIGYNSHYYGKRNVGLFNLLYATFILSMFFVITSGNAVFFFIAWEAMSLLSYLLVVFESENEANQRAGTLYIIMTHIGTAFLLIGFMIMFSYTKSFDMFADSSAIPAFAKNIMFILFLIGFGTKAGVVPVHIWLPHAHPAAPSNISALMSGIMIKTAIYGLLRFVFMYMGIQNKWWGVAILIIGIITAIIGVSYAFIEKNIKRLLAYSSIENIGILFIGLGVAFIAKAQGNLTVCALAITAALFHSFNHTLFKGSLFLGAGSVHYATHSKNMEELGGLIKKMPVTAIFMLGGALAVSAIVPFNGFASEWLTFQSLFANIALGQAGLNIAFILAVAALAMAGAFAAACFIKLFGISFLGKPRSKYAANAKEVPAVMNIAMGILTSFCLLIGLFPMLVLRFIDKVVFSLVGSSIFGQFQGGFLTAAYPLKIAENAISPFTILIAIIGVILLTLIIIRIIGGKYIERKYGTWDCGYEALNARMQYSATGFSNPIKIIFKLLFQPTRRLKVEGNLVYHPKSIEYITSFESVFEKYLYSPLLNKTRNFSRKAKFLIQTGSINTYLIYIFIVVIALILYNRLV